MKRLSINGFESEVIPSSSLVEMLRRLAEKQGKAVEIREPKKFLAKLVLILIAVVFGIGLLLSVVRA